MKVFLVHSRLLALGFQPLSLADARFNCSIKGYACEHNPRKLKRFLNDLLVDEELYQSLHDGEKFVREAYMIDRGLRHQSKKIYSALMADEDLCNDLATFEDKHQLKEGIARLKKERVDDTQLVGQVLPELEARKSLLDLLLSTNGRKWLEEPELRRKIAAFTRLRRTGSRETEQIGKALNMLETGGRTSKLRAMHLLMMFKGHLDEANRKWACKILSKLAESDVKQIRESAVVTVQRLECGG